MKFRKYIYDKRGNRLYSHTFLHGESDRRWFARTHTPLGLVLKAPLDPETLVKNFEKMAPVKRKLRFDKYGPSKQRAVIPYSSDVQFKYIDRTPQKRSARQVVAVKDTPKKGAGSQQLVYNRSRNVTRGTFRGRFKRPKRVKKASIYNRKGVVFRKEITGVGDDANCMYVKAEACPAEETIRVVVAALVRRILEKTGFRCISWDAEPASYFPGTPDVTVTMYRVMRLYQMDMSNQTITAVSAGYAVDGNRFSEIVDQWIPYFKDYIAGYGSVAVSNRHKLVGFSISEDVRNAVPATESRVISTLLFSQCSVLVNGSVTLKVQNRTLAVDNSTEADDVGSNPLEGRLYTFSGIPKPKVMGNVDGAGYYSGASFKFENYYVGQEGVSCFNPATMDASFKEPPVGSTFWNCVGSSKIRLDPGQIKQYTIKDGYKPMMVEKLLKTIHCQVADYSSDFYYWNNKRNLMIALEDVIGVNANVINIAFEAERTMKAVAFEKKKSFMLPDFTYETISEN